MHDAKGRPLKKGDIALIPVVNDFSEFHPAPQPPIDNSHVAPDAELFT